MQKVPEAESAGTNVQVAVRCRPVNAQEREIGCPMCVQTETLERKVNVTNGTAGKKTTKTFNFDRVFGMYSTQEEVFTQMVMPLVQETLAGFNCTVFAYGQTGTGKTHTMEGDIHSEENAGIVPRSVKAILEQLEQSGAEFTIRVSFLEIYNEELQDLLIPPNSDKKLKLCEVEKKGVVCQNLEEITVLSVKDIFEILQRGILQRQTAATLCNKNSSRSHSIFTMKIMIKECNVDGEEVVRHGQLNLVDLAGSECVGRSGAKNDRAREAGSINQSLLTLGRVITALVDHHGHIPYRDSKLTRLLQESLGGKAKTCIIATLSPSANAVEESLSTLDYAHRAKNIKNMPQVNQRMTKKTVMKEYCEEIESLRAQLQANREKNGIYVQPDVYYGMEAKMESQAAQLVEVESVLKLKIDEVKAAKADRDEMEDKLGGIESELSATTSQLQTTTVKLQKSETECMEVTAQAAASRAVISEQQTTESDLMSTGVELQEEVTQQRSDRSHLFTKVEKLKENEGQRRQKTETFVEEMLANTSTLFQGVNGLLSNNDAEAKKICNGVNEMLTRGRDTCSSVTDCIGQAVQALIHKSESNTQVSSSLNDINIHLASTNVELAKALQDMQHQLSAWLGEVDSSMQATQIMLSQQAQKTVEMQQAIVTNATHMSEVASAFSKEQAFLSEKSMNTAISLKSDIATLFTENGQKFEEMAKTASSDMAEKTNIMQAKMVEMFTDIISSNKKSMEGMSKTIMANYESAQQILKDKTDKMQNMRAEAFTSSTDTVSQLIKANASSSETSIAHASSIVSLRKQVKDHLSGISAAVGGKRSFLETTVGSVVSNTETSIAQASKTVGNTAVQVGALVSEIKEAAVEMNTVASKSISDFTVFMDSQGLEICSSVGDHFGKLATYLEATSTEIGTMQEKTTVFNTTMKDCVVMKTGHTPTKAVLTSNENVLQTLQSTRDHAIIRSEYVAGTWQAREQREASTGYMAVENTNITTATTTAADTANVVQTSQEEQFRLEEANDVLSPMEGKQPGKKRADSPVTIDDVENANPNKTLRTSTSTSGKSGLAPVTKTGIARPRTSSRTAAP